MGNERERLTVVTGAASGIGRAAADELRRQGSRVIGVDLRDANILADLSAPQGRTQALDAITAQAPDGIDAIVTCAGIGGGQGANVTSINYFGTIRLVEGVAPLLAKGVDPRAVVIASSTAVLPFDPLLLERCLADDEAGARAQSDDPVVAYMTGKRALCHWVRRTAIRPEWAGAGVLLNGVAPGLIRTPLTEPTIATADGMRQVSNITPIAVADYPRAESIAPLIAFLAGPQSANMVGQIIFTDGGSDVLIRGEAVP
jgi:NAD(P)-dependent dehydrogenase (short-subunit alcohol dehydrogenase family)